MELISESAMLSLCVLYCRDEKPATTDDDAAEAAEAPAKTYASLATFTFGLVLAEFFHRRWALY